MPRLAILIVSLVLASFALVRPIPAHEEATPGAGTPSAADAIAGLETFEVASADHVEGPVTYPQDPPAGGPHNPVWQNCGFYDQPVVKERVVHSQEHGAVWITYRPDLPADQIDALRGLTERSDYVLVSPYPGQQEPVVASAWGAQLRLDGADDRRLRRFIRAYAEKGPERGAPCRTGGTSETIPFAATPAATPGGAAAGTPVAREDA